MSEESSTPAPEATPSAASLLGGGTPPESTPVDPASTEVQNEGFSFGSLMGEDGGFVEGWQDQLTTHRPEFNDYRKTLANYKTPLDALKALGETKALVGRKLNEVETVLNPSPDDPTAMGLYRQVLGIPDEASPEAYEFRPEGELADAVDAETLKDFAGKAHELGLNRKQFAALVEYQAGIMGQTGQAMAAQNEAQDMAAKAQFTKDLETSLGGKDATDQALDLTVRMLRAGGMQDEQIAGEIAPHIHKLGPNFVKAMAELAKNTKEDKLPASGTPATQKMDAKAEYRDIIHNPQNAYNAIYHDPMHPEHKAVREKVRGLIRAAG